ncbi:hypothetical protein K503DRAFT_696265, partial [Rhizopogon vinicolor AM-OR11-026]
TKLHSSVTSAAPLLWQHTKVHILNAWGSLCHWIFFFAFILSFKVICSDTHSNKSWSIVTHGMFQLREINQMELEMCQYLEWELRAKI